MEIQPQRVQRFFLKVLSDLPRQKSLAHAFRIRFSESMVSLNTLQCTILLHQGSMGNENGFHTKNTPPEFWAGIC